MEPEVGPLTRIQGRGSHRLLLAVFLIAAVAPGRSEGQQCEPCELSREFHEAGDTRSAVATALRYAQASSGESTRVRSYLAYLGAVMSPPDLRVLSPLGLDSIVGLEATKTLVSELLAQPSTPHQEALAAYAVLEFRKNRLGAGAFEAITEFGRRVSAVPDLTFPGLSDDLEAQLLLLLASRLTTEIMDRSYRVGGAEAPVVHFRRCQLDGIPGLPCWERNRTYGSGSLDALGGSMRMPDDLVERRGRFLERAFTLAPHLDGVARSLLGDLARQGRWERYNAVARRHAAATNDGAWSLAYLGTGAWRTGLEIVADSLFSRSLLRMSERDAAVLLDVSESVLPSNREKYLSGSPGEVRAWSLFLLKISDPLFLTDHNERRLEHFSRVVLSELWFTDLIGGFSGSTTDPGRILVRYGRPPLITELGPLDPPPPVPDRTRHPYYGLAPTASDTVEAIIWGYGPDRPTFLFHRGMGHFPLQLSSRSLADAEDLRSVEPSTYGALPHQVARFKGPDSKVEVDFYTEIPADTVSEKRLPVQTGVFILPRTLGAEVFTLKADAFVGFERRNVTLVIPFTRDEYVYTIEMLSEDESIKRAARQRLAIDGYRDDRVMLSDLVLARSVSSEGLPPTVRQDVSYDPAVDLSFREDEPVSVFFEVYPPAASLEVLPSGRDLVYTVAVRIRDAVDGTIVEGGTRRGAAGDLRWTRTGLAGRDRVLDWFTLDVPWPGSGLYELEVEIRIPDYPVATGTRKFRVRESARPR